MKNVWVISLGGSRIVPNDVDYVFLRKFKTLLDRHKDKKFVVVCGGGRTARRYIDAFRKLGKNSKDQSEEGIIVTRLHANFMARFFGRGASRIVPLNMRRVRMLLTRNRVVFCGALRWKKNNTSDGNAAQLAGYLGCDFINLTNVRGLYSANPKTNKKAKFISKISWKDFLMIAEKIKYKAGQHFVLDLVAAREILRKRIVTYIVGSLGTMDKILKGNKKINGTLISR